MENVLLTSVSDEFKNADLGDKRLNCRLRQIAEAAQKFPSGSFPERALTPAALEATYRFLNNDNVSAEAIFEAHVHATVGRAEKEDKVLVIHDTTEFRFGGLKAREGLGRLNTEKQQGFLAHFAFALMPDGRPLGSLGLYAWARRRKKRKKQTQTVALRNPERESVRWQDAALSVGGLLHDKCDAIHVMDREGDSFEIFCLLVEHGEKFVIRIAHDRRLEEGRGRSEGPRLFESMSQSTFFFEREVSLEARAPQSVSRGKGYTARPRRQARLQIHAATREIFAAHTAPAHLPISIVLQCVEVREVDPPDGEEPIVWRLLTTEPVETEEQVAAIVDAYRRRWVIEEFFKALKTGCRFQTRQQESGAALLKILAIEAAVAWRMLLLRWAAHHHADSPASQFMQKQHIDLLTALIQVEQSRTLPKDLSVKNALLEIAKLGGHIKNNGPPGWLVLRRGLDKLLTMDRGWKIACSVVRTEM